MQYKSLREEISEPLNILLSSIKKNNKIKIFGHLPIHHQIKKRIKTRIKFEEFYKNNSFKKVNSPLFITGLPRSGTSYLFSLLSLSSNYRSPTYWEIMHGIPEFKNSKNAHKAIRKTEIDLYLAKLLIPKLNQIHHIEATTPEECQQIATMSIKSFVYMCIADVPEYMEYLKESDFTDVFRLHKKFLQAHQNDERKWLLKDPSHIGHIPEILEAYPDAKIINIHRDPSESIASFCSLIENVRKPFIKNIDKNKIGNTVIDYWGYILKKGIDDRQKINNQTIVDIFYKDFIKNPYGEIRKALSFLQVNFDQKLEMQIEKYNTEQAHTRNIKHEYKLENYGLTKEKLRNHLYDYIHKYNF